MYELAQRVLRFEDALIEASDICGQLDRYVPRSAFLWRKLRLFSLVAMAQAANFYKLVRPKMVGENVIKIKGGR